MSLEIRDLTVRLSGRTVVDRVSLDLATGHRLGIIGESGSGKSLTALAVLGLLPRGAQVSGSIRWQGTDLLGLSERELARLRGKELAVVFQEPMTALDPIRTVGAQVGDALRLHYGLRGPELRRRVRDLIARVRLPDPESIARCYPHQLSGGQRQRIAIAQALSAQPRLLIADEPTTALDVTVQAEVIELLEDLTATSGLSLLFITHDIALLNQVVDRALVLAHGECVEQGSVAQLLDAPAHPVTADLVAAARATAWHQPAESR